MFYIGRKSGYVSTLIWDKNDSEQNSGFSFIPQMPSKYCQVVLNRF